MRFRRKNIYDITIHKVSAKSLLYNPPQVFFISFIADRKFKKDSSILATDIWQGEKKEDVREDSLTHRMYVWKDGYVSQLSFLSPFHLFNNDI